MAAQYSIEPGSQALRGEVPPIKKNGGQPQLEEEAFKLKPGELSGVIQVDDKFVILRCEGFTAPSNAKFDEVKKDIHEDLYEKKLRLAMAECYENLQKAATIDNYLTGISRAPYKVPLGGPEEASAATAGQSAERLSKTENEVDSSKKGGTSLRAVPLSGRLNYSRWDRVFKLRPTLIISPSLGVLTRFFSQDYIDRMN